MIRTAPAKRFFLLCVFSSCLLLTGCWDRTEINDIAIVLATAIDKEQNGQYRVTIQIPLPGQLGGPSGGGGGTGGNKTYYIDSDTGHTIREANDKLQKRMARKLFYAHRRVMVIGEDLAREGIEDILDIVARMAQNRLSAYTVVAEGKGYELLNAEVKLERFSSEVIRELAQSETAIKLPIKDISHMMTSGGIDPIMLYMGIRPTEKSESPSREIQVLGYAQFRHGKMVHVIKDRAARGLNYLTNEPMLLNETLPLSSGQWMTFRISRHHTAIQSTPRENRVHYRIHVEVTADLLEDMTRLNGGPVRNLQWFQDELADYIEQEIRDAIRVMQNHRADSAGLGGHLSRQYPGIWKAKYARNWREHLAIAEFSVEVVPRIATIGLISDNIVREEGNEE